jgi:TetR/AcrR family transcriptional regulator, regulator of mycofactocin system
MINERASATSRPGRRPATSKAELSQIALELFAEHGFEDTTVDDIVAAAGIGRRTFFRYFDSKNDLPWGDFDAHLQKMREYLAALSDDLPLMEALRLAVVEFNRLPPDEVPVHRQRMQLLLSAPTLMAYSTLRYQDWRDVVAEYAARRLGVPPDGLMPTAIAWSLLGIALAAYEQWLRDESANLSELLDQSLQMLNKGFAS